MFNGLQNSCQLTFGGGGWVRIKSFWMYLRLRNRTSSKNGSLRTRRYTREKWLLSGYTFMNQRERFYPSNCLIVVVHVPEKTDQHRWWQQWFWQTHRVFFVMTLWGDVSQSTATPTLTHLKAKGGRQEEETTTLFVTSQATTKMRSL